MAQCFHCRKSVVAHRMRAHASVCVSDPRVAERIKCSLRHISPFGVLVSQSKYVALYAGKNGLPSQKFLFRRFGSWGAVAEWAGLRPQCDYKEVLWKETRSLLVELAFGLYGGSYGPSREDWEARRHEDMPCAALLLKRFTTWSSVLAWAGGLEQGSKVYYGQQQVERDRLREQVVERRMAVRRRLAEAEDKLADAPYGGIAVTGESRVVTYYDWSTRCYRQRIAATVR